MKRIWFMSFFILILAVSPCMASSWELVVTDDKTTPYEDRWSIDVDSIFWMRSGYVEAWVKGECIPPVLLPGDKKNTKMLFHYIGFTKTKQMCIIKTDQRFADGSAQSAMYECKFVDIEPYSAGMYFWRFLFNSR